METVAQKENQPDAQKTIVFPVMDGVFLHIEHDSIPAFMLMRSTQVQAMTEFAVANLFSRESEGVEWALRELASQLHQLLPHAIQGQFAVSVAK